MVYKQVNDTTDWIAKEKREMFRTCLNTMFMSQDPKTQLKPLAELMKLAQQIVDTAFKLYPDKDNSVDWDKVEETQKWQKHYNAVSKADSIKQQEQNG